MKRLKMIAAAALAIVLMGTLAIPALAADSYGSSAVSAGSTYSLEEMLTYAIEDEYLASAEYNKIIETLGAVRPFTNIVRAEATHIAALNALFTAYGFDVPADTASGLVTVPADISSALSTGVEAEQSNIAMYDAFLAETTLPDDVRAVFNALKSASEFHLAAFNRSLERPAGTNAGAGNAYGAGGQRGGPHGSGTGICDGTGAGVMAGGHGMGGNRAGTGGCGAGACLLS